MSSLFDKISNHQRILITGPRKDRVFEICQKVLDTCGRTYSIVDNTGNLHENDRAIVFILQGGEVEDHYPHIALIDTVTDADQDSYMNLANSIPKSGTLVYNTDNKIAEAICEIERADVHIEKYRGDETAAAKSLLRRIGVSSERFENALK